MKKYLTITLLLICSISIGVAQHGRNQDDNKRNQIHTEINNMKIAFITESLQLTPEESQVFWPIYNQYWNNRVENNKELRDIYKRINKNTATQADLDKIIAISAKETTLLSDFIAQLKKVISVDKTAKVFVAEEQFKYQLMHRAKGIKRNTQNK